MTVRTQLPAVVARQGRLPPRTADRAKAFRAALRHSARVRILKLALPICAAAVTGVYFLPSSVKVETKAGTVDIKEVDFSKDGFKMTNVKMNGVHEKHGRYNIEAENLIQNVKQPELVTLHKVTAELTSLTGAKTRLTAPGGFYHSKKEELTFDKGVEIGGDAGVTGHLKTATAYVQNHVLISADPVQFAYYDSTIKSESMTAYTNESRVIFTGNVQAHLERPQKPAKTPPNGPQGQAVPGGLSLDYSKNSNKPVDITASKLEVDDKKKIATFRDAVSATQGDFNLKSRELVVVYATSGGGTKALGPTGQAAAGAQVSLPVEGRPAAAAPASPEQAQASAGPLPGGGNSEITEIRANGEVVVTAKDSQECHGESALYDAKRQTVTLLGNVQCAKASENVIKGERLVLNLNEGTTKVDSIVDDKPGRISVVLQPREKPNKKPKKPAEEKEGSNPTGMTVDYSQNANKPVNITAESLNVEDKKKLATFLGAVSATQGDFNMKSRELKVVYTSGDKANTQTTPGGGNEITEIRANGAVIITTKDSQECRGDTAVYNVKQQLVTVQGHVRVSKGADNVISGEKMVINLADNTTKFDARPSLIFKPEDKDKQPKPDAAQGQQ